MRQARPRIGISARALPALAAFAIALALASAAQARPGDLDRSFSRDGRVATGFVPQGEDRADAVAVQHDGRIVAAGVGRYAALARYLPGGSLDPSFGGDGRRQAGQIDEFTAVAIDTHNRIVVAGNSNNRMRVVRYLASGERDDSFGDGGIVSRFGLGGTANAQDLELGRGGGIIVSGSGVAPERANSDFAVVKLSGNGALDQSFGNGGVKLINVAGKDFGSGLAIDRFGRITVGGYSIFGGSNHASFARLKPSGRIDRSFSGNGRKILKRLGDADEVAGIAAKPNGSIVAAGTTYRFSNDGNELDMFLAKLRPDGSMSRKFGRRGTRTIDIHSLDRASDVAFQADGKIVIAGASKFLFAVLRVTRQGRLDSTFSGNGMTLTSIHGSSCVASGLTLQPNGRIVTAGWMYIDFDDPITKFALARYKNDGRPAGP